MGLSAAKEAEDVQRAQRVWLGLSEAKEAEEHQVELSRDNAEGVVATTVSTPEPPLGL